MLFISYLTLVLLLLGTSLLSTAGHIYALFFLLKGYYMAVLNLVQAGHSFDRSNLRERWLHRFICCYALEPWVTPFWLAFVLSQADFERHHRLGVVTLGLLPLIIVLLATQINALQLPDKPLLTEELRHGRIRRIMMAGFAVFCMTYLSRLNYTLFPVLTVFPVIMGSINFAHTMINLHDNLCSMAQDRQRILQP